MFSVNFVNRLSVPGTVPGSSLGEDVDPESNCYNVTCKEGPKHRKVHSGPHVKEWELIYLGKRTRKYTKVCAKWLQPLFNLGSKLFPHSVKRAGQGETCRISMDC